MNSTNAILRILENAVARRASLMLPVLQLATAVSSAALVRSLGTWSRDIGCRHFLGPPPGQTGPPQPLWGGTAKTAGARSTSTGSSNSISLAHDPITAFTEVSALIVLPGDPVPVRSAPWVVTSVDGILNNLLDLTDPATLAALGTTAQEMTGTWVANWSTCREPHWMDYRVG